MVLASWVVIFLLFVHQSCNEWWSLVEWSWQNHCNKQDIHYPPVSLVYIIIIKQHLKLYMTQWATLFELVATYIILFFMSSKLSMTKYKGWSPSSGYLVTMATSISKSLCSGWSVMQYCSSWELERIPAPYAFSSPPSSRQTPNSTVYQ